MILCHIVGINNKLKDEFTKEINRIIDVHNSIIDVHNSIYVIDLDILSKKIIFEKTYTKLYDEFNQPGQLNKSKLLSQLSIYWKSRLADEVNKLLGAAKYIILIGMITFYLDLRVRVNFSEEIKNTFFINSDTEKHLRNLIEYNLETYKTDIISGKFPLKYLDIVFLRSQREHIKEIYMIRDYKLKTYDNVIEFIKHKVQQVQPDRLDTVYFASHQRFENQIDIPGIRSGPIGYSDKWIALISLFSKNKFSRSISLKNGVEIPLIKELGPLNLRELNTCCYLYELYPGTKIDERRYLIEDNKFIRRYYVSNIKLELDMYNTVFEKFTYI